MARLRPICLVCALVFIAAKSGAENPHNAVLHSRDPWERTLRELYDRSQAAAGFCFGSDPFKLFRAAITLSFPWPLPAQGDSIHDACSSYPNITLHLCTPDDVLFYYKFLLRTNDPEKAPGTAACPVGTSKPPCAPGFFGINGTAHACCAGYFCPRGLQCMMPCPLGAHCPAAVPALPPKPYQGRSSGATGLWCAPYAYRLRSTKDGVGRCGGADRWTIVPELAFPGAQWDAGSGNLYCEGRYYCPNTTARVLCPRGYFCKQGSTLPEHCPPGSLCPPGTEVPLNNYGGEDFSE